MAKPEDRRAKLAREMSHRMSADERLRAYEAALNPPSQEDIDTAIKVGMGRMSPDVAYGEKPLAGGLDIAEIGGIPINATDFIGTGIPSKLAMGAKMFAAPLAAALGGTAIASQASQGAKLNALANLMRKERGIFAGVNAKTADMAKLEEAKQLAAQGVPDADIWAQTGWTLDTPDKMPRFEIPDDAARLNLEDAGYLGVKHSFDDLDKSVSHEDLYSAYPEIKGYGGDISQTPGGLESGSFKAGKMSGKPSIRATGDDATGTVLHELQHAIQQREGFARGGSPELFKESNSPLIPEMAARNQAVIDVGRMAKEYGMSPEDVLRSGAIDEPHASELLSRGLDSGQWDYMTRYANERALSPDQAYKRLAGEAEARLTQARMNLTPYQRLAQYPYEPEYFLQATGVPLDELIVRKGGDGTAMSLPDNLDDLWTPVDTLQHPAGTQYSPINKYLNNPDYNTGMDVPYGNFPTRGMYEEIIARQKADADFNQSQFQDDLHRAIEADAGLAASRGNVQPASNVPQRLSDGQINGDDWLKKQMEGIGISEPSPTYDAQRENLNAALLEKHLSGNPLNPDELAQYEANGALMSNTGRGDINAMNAQAQPEYAAYRGEFDTPAYHGTDRKFSEFDPEEKYAASNSMGSWFTDDPLQAAFYADPSNRGKGDVMRALLRVEDPYEIDAMADARRIADDIGIDPNLNWGNASEILQYSDYVEDAIKDASRLGKKSLVVRNTADAPNRSDDLATHYSIFDPRNIRLKTAAFDPLRRNSANILAGGAAGAVGLNELADLLYLDEYQ